MNNLVDEIFKLDRLTILNIILGLLIAITPDDYIAFANASMSNPDILANGDTNPVFLFIIGMIFLLVWLADFWASKHRANIIYAKRVEQEKKGVSMIGGYGYLHIFTSLTMATVIGSLLGSLINAIAVFIPILAISALVKEPYLIYQITRIRKKPVKAASKRKDFISDVILLLYAYLVFIISWQSFVISGDFIIDLDKSSGVFSLFYVTIIYLIFYLGACWLWFEEITVNLKNRKQLLFFIGSFILDIVIVIMKLIK